KERLHREIAAANQRKEWAGQRIRPSLQHHAVPANVMQNYPDRQRKTQTGERGQILGCGRFRRRDRHHRGGQRDGTRHFWSSEGDVFYCTIPDSIATGALQWESEMCCEGETPCACHFALVSYIPGRLAAF